MMADLRGASVAHARRALADRFRAASLDTPELDARILIGHALGLDHTGLVSAASQQISDLTASQIERFAARRLSGEPVARIVGTKEFWGLPLMITPAVLVPRPETETAVELALALIDDRTRALRLADLGTGSGALLLALLTELPNAHGIGTDIDPAALAVARHNAARLGLARRASFAATDYTAALAGPFDLIVANPPYITSRDIAGLPADVREHDPPGALDGGADGLAAYRAIVADAARVTGSVVVEIGRGQEAEVERLFAQVAFRLAATRADLAGITRAIAFSHAPRA